MPTLRRLVRLVVDYWVVVAVLAACALLTYLALRGYANGG